MTSLKDLLKKYDLTIENVKYLKSAKIIDTKKGKYVIKIKTSSNHQIYDYLLNRNFENVLLPINNSTDTYEIYPYIESENISNEDKAQNLIYTLSLLHNYTTIYENLNLDTVKEIYETTQKELENLDYYYHDLQDYIENKVFMAPEEYLLIRNISNVYNAITYSKNSLEKWYQEKTKQTTERQVLLHNNLSLDHFLISKDNAFLINWNKSTRGYPIYDLVGLFKSSYKDIEFENLYKYYQKKYKYTTDEQLLFNVLIAKPWKIEFSNNHYDNTIIVNDLIEYIVKGSLLVSKKHEKDQEAE